MRNDYYNGYDASQRQLQTTNRGLVIAFRLLLKALVFSPLIFTGYLLAVRVLDKKAHGLLWVTVILIFAGLLYTALMMLKNIINELKNKGNYWWIPVFFLCIAFTCILPARLIYDPLNHIVLQMKGTPAVTRMIDVCFAVYVYFQYDFLGHKEMAKK
jgi:hypothetical protein